VLRNAVADPPATLVNAVMTSLKCRVHDLIDRTPDMSVVLRAYEGGTYPYGFPVACSGAGCEAIRFTPFLALLEMSHQLNARFARPGRVSFAPVGSAAAACHLLHPWHKRWRPAGFRMWARAECASLWPRHAGQLLLQRALSSFRRYVDLGCRSGWRERRDDEGL
jgi:hypothetical protein